MAPIGTVLKNGLIFLILSLPFIYLGSALLLNALILYVEGASSVDPAGILLMAVAMVCLIGGVGVVYMKTLSDTVEDGMIEF